MAGLNYVGATPAVSNDILNRLALNATLNAITPNQGSVTTQITNLYSGASPTYATKAYVDSQDATFASPSYVSSRDALNLPTTAVGTVAGSPITGSYYGAASLDSSGKVPIAQIPNMGVGYLLGPWGPTATFNGTTGATPLRIADWNLGLPPIQFRPWVFLNAFVTAITGAKPIIEIRIANTVTQPAYASTTLVSQGEGRYGYTDYHAIACLPVPDTTSETPSLLATSYEIWLSAWLYDLSGGTNSVTISAGGIASAPAFLWRGAL